MEELCLSAFHMEIRNGFLKILLEKSLFSEELEHYHCGKPVASQP